MYLGLIAVQSNSAEFFVWITFFGKLETDLYKDQPFP
jgi:hypothetical protein